MIRFIIAVFLMGVLCGLGYADSIADVALSKKSTQLLGDRLRIRMPKGSKVEARAVSIMAAKESPENETRVVFDLGKKRLVLMAYETFSMAGKNFAAEVKKMGQKASQDGRTAKTRLVVNRDGFQVYQTEVGPIDKNRKTIVIASAWVVNTDQTVQVLMACANPSAVTELQDVRKLYSQALKTLEPGDKRLSTKARKKALDVYSKTKNLVVQIPDGWVHTVQPGPDFLVHSLRKLAPFAKETPSIGVYVGGHPSYHHRRREAKPEKSEGTLIGKKVDWFKVSDGKRVLMEAIRPAQELDGSLMFHVFLSAPSEKELESVRHIVKSMRIVKKDAAKKDREPKNAPEKK